MKIFSFQKKLTFCWFAIITSALIVIAIPVQAQSKNELVFGRISDNPRDSYEELKPLLDYVIPRMKEVGITKGRILMARDVPQMLGFLRRGQVDWISETTAMGSLLYVKGGAVPVLMTERGHKSEYSTVIFVRKDSGIKSLSQLVGKRIAFQRPSSTTSFFVPASMLLQQNLRLQNLVSPFSSADAKEVGYIFALSERNIATWVHKHIVEAGSLSDVDWDDPQKVSASFKNDFVIIARSKAYPRALELVSSNLSPKVRARLEKVLIDASNDPSASIALKNYYDTKIFIPIGAKQRQELKGMGNSMLRVREALE